MTERWSERVAEIRRSLDARDKYAMHYDQYDCSDYVPELIAEVERLRDWIDGCQSCGLISYDACQEAAITLVRAVQTCGACPAQWDAWDADGQTYYLRFRSGVGTVEAVSTPTTTPESLNDARTVAEFRYGNNLLGSIELDLFCRLAGLRLAENAEVM